MTSEPMLLEPELESLLREVAADPDSSLLRVPRAKALPMLYEDRPAAGPATAGLSLAEREILRVHRLEVAWLLRQVCVWRLVEGSRSRMFVSRYVTAQDRRAPLRPSALVEGYRLETHIKNGDADLSLALALLSQAVARTSNEDPCVLELAAASQCLHPSNEARILGGQDLALHHSARSALHLLSPLSLVDLGTSIGISNWTTLGYAHLTLGQMHRAHGAYRRASELGEARPGPWMDRLAMSLQVGSAEDARHSSEHLDHILGDRQQAVEWYVESRQSRRRLGEWRPTDEATRLTVQLQEHLGAAGRRICHVFA